MFCSRCGKEAGMGAVYCSACGEKLVSSQPVVVEVDHGFSCFFPKNVSALIAYYLGIFSLFCFLISIPAFVFGIAGLIRVKKYPEERGKVHSWIGIIMGALGTFFWFVLFLIFLGSYQQ